jgi:hypothetical protein
VSRRVHVCVCVVLQEWLFWMTVSSLLGVLMTYSTVLCNSYNSPLATSVTGNTKDIVSTLIGECPRTTQRRQHFPFLSLWETMRLHSFE